MEDILARVFIVFLLVLYGGIALVFVVVSIRNLIWYPVKNKLLARRPEKGYRRVKSASREQSPS